jgi:hypothetical protein
MPIILPVHTVSNKALPAVGPVCGSLEGSFPMSFINNYNSIIFFHQSTTHQRLKMKLQKLLKGRSPDNGVIPGAPESSLQGIVSSRGIDKNSSAYSEGGRVLQPTQFDVLFGRGKPFQGHAGNIRLHKVVDVYKGRYSQARRHEKTEIAEEIVQFIKNGGSKAGRFLKRAEGEECWIQVSDSIARDKVSHALRGKPRKEEGPIKAFTVIDDHAATKRPIEAAASPTQAKRRKLVVAEATPSDLELLATQRKNSFLSQLSSSSALLASAGYPSSLSLDLRAQLMTSALADRQMGLGALGSQLGGLQGFLGHSHGFSNPLLSNQSLIGPLLQSLRSDHASTDSCRLW